MRFRVVARNDSAPNTHLLSPSCLFRQVGSRWDLLIFLTITTVYMSKYFSSFIYKKKSILSSPMTSNKFRLPGEVRPLPDEDGLKNYPYL
jgi:hypothetical protein